MQKPARSKGEPHTYFAPVSAKLLFYKIYSDLLNCRKDLIFLKAIKNYVFTFTAK